MSSRQIHKILTELEHLRKQVAEVPMLKSRIEELESRPIGSVQPPWPLPAKKGSPALRLINVARSGNREAAITLAKSFSKADTANRRKEKS